MVAVKTQQAGSFLKSLDKKIEAILVYGPDAGMVSERAREAAEKFASREKPPGEILRIEDLDLENDTDRLAVELMTVPMFGGRKVVRTSASRRINAQILKPLLENPLAGWLVVEAGNLKRDDAMRLLFEKAAHAAAIPCYPDDARDVGQLIDEVVASFGLSIARDAREALVARLGADRAMSRGEIEKLALYVGQGTIGLDDVDAIVGDASELAVERIVAAAVSGRSAQALEEMDRATSGGETAGSVILALERHLQRLHRLRSEIDNGRSAEDVIRGMRPPLPLPVQRQLESQAKTWTLPRLTVALTRCAHYVAQSRQTGAPDDLLAQRFLMEIATRAAPQRRS